MFYFFFLTVISFHCRLCKKHPQVAVLAANCVLQDCADLNPVVKVLGLGSLAAIPDLEDLAPAVLLGLLSDGHPRVRLAAVHGCRTLQEHAPASLSQHGLINALYATVRDQDPQVSAMKLLEVSIIYIILTSSNILL